MQPEALLWRNKTVLVLPNPAGAIRVGFFMPGVWPGALPLARYPYEESSDFVLPGSRKRSIIRLDGNCWMEDKLVCEEHYVQRPRN